MLACARRVGPLIMSSHKCQPRTGELGRCELATKEPKHLEAGKGGIKATVNRSTAGETDRVQVCILRDSSISWIRYCGADVPHRSGCIGAASIELAFRCTAFSVGK